MEIFLFLIVGGVEDEIDLRLLYSAQDPFAWEELVEELESFDARAAECSLQEDEDRMISAIARAFGSLEAFNAHIRHILSSILRPSPDNEARLEEEREILSSIFGSSPDNEVHLEEEGIEENSEAAASVPDLGQISVLDLVAKGSESTNVHPPSPLDTLGGYIDESQRLITRSPEQVD